uniref:Cadherin domain-containing protein n=1 Tax=Anas platyrhynchos TaxID=8839 RepID=A0A8B9SL60_ANAPL
MNSIFYSEKSFRKQTHRLKVVSLGNVPRRRVRGDRRFPRKRQGGGVRCQPCVQCRARAAADGGEAGTGKGKRSRNRRRSLIRSPKRRVERRELSAGTSGGGGAVSEMCTARQGLWGRRQRALLCCVLVAAWEAAWGQLRYSVPEELPKGSFVGDVAKDLALQPAALRDRGARVVSADRTQYFTLHANSGHLVTAERLDREQLCDGVQRCVLRCEVIVEGEMKVYEIEVEIMDINDNAPTFSEIQIEETLSETTGLGTRLPLSKAHDPDVGVNSLQSYELSGDEHFSLSVQVGADGEKRPELVLAKALDREEAAFHELVLRASDGGEPARTGTARIRVSVLDANDNAPVFSQAVYAVRVPEDVPVGSTLLTLTATDADEGINGDVKYSLKKISEKASKIFHLDPETGSIRLMRTLDFEESDSYELGVQARDSGELFDTAMVSISVSDVNDNAPEISVRSALSEISEDAPPGTVVALLHVQDRDSVANGEVRCSLVGDVPFRLRSSVGSYYSVVTSRELDREEVSEYNVTVWASDGGSPSLRSSAVLALRVLDVNDNAPVFAEARYSARLPENNAEGALVLTVRAWDADWGQNARVRYRLAEGRVRGAPLSSYVSVQAETGALYALRSFDYEEVREVGLWVRAEDGGAPALSSNVSVRLLIVDENDNAPQVLYPPSSSSETTTRKQPHLQENNTLVISNRMRYFALHANSGHLVTAERLDREQLCRLVERCVLHCEVIVEGEMKVYEIEVEIMDINDNAPSFGEGENEVRMSEMTAPASRFSLSKAHDPDVGVNSLQSYELSGDEHFSLSVQVGADGEKRPELVLAKALDREEAAFHELVLRAIDGGEPARTGTARIRVSVLDANDNAPVFSQAVYAVRVPEDVPVGSTLLTLTATDADEGLNGDVKYSFKGISKKFSRIFHLDPETGSIRLLRSLDFEEGNSYEMEFEANDGGGLSDNAVVIISVTDVNDNAPEISVRSALSEISEDAPPGTVVALLHVQDRDSGANGEVRCSIVESLPFHLERALDNYYSVVTARELDREEVSEYNVTVWASDGGSPSLRSSAVLALRVLDVNDNAPVFAEARYSARLPENNAEGALVLTVRAWDADWGQNARVRYRLAEGRVRGAPLSSYVSVQAETGALYALRSFDYEEVREVGLWVRAEDGGAPALSSNVSVRLLITYMWDCHRCAGMEQCLLAGIMYGNRAVLCSSFQFHVA